MRKKKNDYFEFLYETGFADGDHRELALYLNKRPFEWSLDADENRMDDGLAMRREFEDVADKDNCRYDGRYEAYDISDVLDGGSCTMLEFFVGFAYRLVRDLFSDNVVSVHEVVERMLKNLDIWKYDDEYFDSTQQEEVEEYIDEKLDDWIDREYDFDGSRGGIFVIPECRDDLAETEMWVQASWWYNYWYC